MAYTTRYKIAFNNELDELVEVYLDAKNGAGGSYTGSAYLTEMSTHSFAFAGLGIIDAIAVGAIVTIGTGLALMGPFTITAFVYNPGTDAYTITLLEDISGGGFGFNTFTISTPGFTGAVENLTVISCEINVNSDSSDIMDSVNTRELLLTINATNADSIDYDTFLDSNHDDWLVRAEVDGVPVFHGFLIPDEGPTPFQDKPYEITLHASDGLKLLSKQTLLKQDDSEFDSLHALIDLVAACLFRTGLNLPIRVYCNIYYNPMKTRNDDIKYDMLQQAFLDYRTFMTSSTAFVDCYTALGIIFKDHFKVYYEEGRWVIYRIPEYQYLATADRYYTDYNAAGVIIDGGIDTSDYAKVGKANIIRPINENQTWAGKFANKTVRHTFNYNIWDEIPRNNKFERATLDPAAPNTTTEKYYTIDDWIYGRLTSPTVPAIIPPYNPRTTSAWRKSTYNAYNIEISREIQLRVGATRQVFICEPIPVNLDDIIKISFQLRTNVNHDGGSGTTIFCGAVYIKATNGDIYTLINPDINNLQKGVWQINAINPLATYYTSVDNFGIYQDTDVTSAVIPADGQLYVAFFADPGSLAGHTITDYFIRSFTIEYTPYVSGGYVPVKGDYWTRSQNKTFPDTIDDEVLISDSGIGASKGTLFYVSGSFIVKTVPDWWRFGLGGSEIRHYKELVNIGQYNLSYRRFRKIEGEFDGTTYEVNNDLMRHPLSFTIRYGFEDLPELRLFVLICPLKIDLIKGRFQTTFQEVYKDSADGTQEGDSSSFKYLFE